MMSNMGRPARLADDVETKKRWREIQFIINIIEPDPKYQPAFVSDEASLLDALCTDEDDMLRKLAHYFGASFDFDIRQPLWKLVDQLKNAYIEWPDGP